MAVAPLVARLVTSEVRGDELTAEALLSANVALSPDSATFLPVPVLPCM